LGLRPFGNRSIRSALFWQALKCVCALLAIAQLAIALLANALLTIAFFGNGSFGNRPFGCRPNEHTINAYFCRLLFALSLLENYLLLRLLRKRKLAWTKSGFKLA